jgi:hypothetical protein
MPAIKKGYWFEERITRDGHPRRELRGVVLVSGDPENLKVNWVYDTPSGGDAPFSVHTEETGVNVDGEYVLFDETKLSHWEELCHERQRSSYSPGGPLPENELTWTPGDWKAYAKKLDEA